MTGFTTRRNCAFVNFTNISNAIKAIDSVKNKPDYTSLRIAHGKDRCANPPRSGPQGGTGGMRRASGNSNSAPPGDGDEEKIEALLADDGDALNEHILETRGMSVDDSVNELRQE